MKLERVPLEWVNITWPLVAPHFAQAVQHSQDGYTLDHIQVMVTTGQWMLVVFTEGETVCGALTLLFLNRPAERVAFITALGGKSVFSEDTTQQLRALAASQGAMVIEGAVRKSVARLAARYGFMEKTRIIKLKV
jgi:hypothetical protein